MVRLLIMTMMLFHGIVVAKTTLDIKDLIATQADQIACQGVSLAAAKHALAAYYNAVNMGVKIAKSVLTIIDYSLPSTCKRFWVINLKDNRVLHTSLVAHGQNSGDKYTRKFSNIDGSHQTSIGTFLTMDTYYGQDGYSLKIRGLEKENDQAEKRYIVIHGAPYVSDQFIAKHGRLGRSWGCPAVEKCLARPIIDTIKNGSLVVAYYPDRCWLKNSKFINANCLLSQKKAATKIIPAC